MTVVDLLEVAAAAAVAGGGSDSLFVRDNSAAGNPHANQNDDSKQGDDDAHNFLPIEQVVTAVHRLPTAQLFSAEIA